MRSVIDSIFFSLLCASLWVLSTIASLCRETFESDIIVFTFRSSMLILHCLAFHFVLSQRSLFLFFFFCDFPFPLLSMAMIAWTPLHFACFTPMLSLPTIPFTKMHGAGNDYIYVDTSKYPLDNPSDLSVRWSADHTGIKSDGLVLISASTVADFGMRIFNADGSEARMCGNASRCVGKYVYEAGLTKKTSVTLETLAGVKQLELHLNGDQVDTVTVNMGPPVLGTITMETLVGGTPYTGTVVSMGNPHFVVFVENLDAVDVAAVGSQLEYYPALNERTNVEFAQVLSRDTVRMRVWERGSGITRACGTGACATVAAAVARGFTDDRVTVKMDGGALEILWKQAAGDVYMTGDAIKVFEGVVSLPN